MMHQKTFTAEYAEESFGEFELQVSPCLTVNYLFSLRYTASSAVQLKLVG